MINQSMSGRLLFLLLSTPGVLGSVTTPEHCVASHCDDNVEQGLASIQACNEQDDEEACVGLNTLCEISAKTQAGLSDGFGEGVTVDLFSDCDCDIDTAAFGSATTCESYLSLLQSVCEKLEACAIPPEEVVSSESPLPAPLPPAPSPPQSGQSDYLADGSSSNIEGSSSNIGAIAGGAGVVLSD